MSCQFTLGATTKTIRSPQLPESVAEPPRQTIGTSGGGKHWVYTRGSAAKRIHLLFARLTGTEKSDLESFIKTTVNYSEKTFTYTDPNSVAHTDMRFVDFGNMFERDGGVTNWRITLTLERDET